MEARQGQSISPIPITIPQLQHPLSKIRMIAQDPLPPLPPLGENPRTPLVLEYHYHHPHTSPYSFAVKSHV